MTEELRIGLVGCGRLAEYGHVPAAAIARGVRLAAVADLHPSRCKAAAPDVPAYRSLEALVDGGDVDAVVIATPAAAHLEGARVAARAGLPTLVEKPPAPDLHQAAELNALEPRPWIGFNRRFDPGLERLRKAARLPERVDLRLELQYRRSEWRSYVVADDALDDVGTHLVDLARWIPESEVESARAVELRADYARVELHLARGRARLTCGADSRRRETFELRSMEGRRLASHAVGSLPSGLRRLRQLRRANSLVASLAWELEAFCRAVRGGGGPHPATAADGVAAMAVLAAVRRSAADKGGWQPVRLPPRPDSTS